MLLWTEQSSEPVLTTLAGVVPGSSSTKFLILLTEALWLIRPLLLALACTEIKGRLTY